MLGALSSVGQGRNALRALYAGPVASAPAFRLFGFPVRVRGGFLIFLLLIVGVNGTAFGPWLALSIAAFTLLHELGHAFAARATGARAEISLDFMAGYASFVPTRPLSRLERAAISFAGPGVQIVLGLLLFVLVNGGFSWPSADEHLQFAVMWAGPAIGLFNLIPILPFDGGNILEQLVAVFAPDRAREIMIGITLAVVGGGVVYAVLHPPLRPFIVFMLVPLLSVVQLSQARKRSGGTGAGGADEQRRLAVSRAEALAWATGDVAKFPPGTGPSPWFRAHQQLLSGNPEVARRLILDDLAGGHHETTALRWYPPDAAPVDALHRLVFLLHDPLLAPTVDSPTQSCFVMADVLLRVGAFERAGHFAAAAYPMSREPALALAVARAAAALGDRPTALAWLRALAASLPPVVFASAVEQAPELAAVRADPEFERLRSR